MLRLKSPFALMQHSAHLALIVVATLFFVMISVPAHAQSTVRPPDNATNIAPLGPDMQGGVLGNESDARIWHDIRLGAPGSVSIPDGKAATMIQSQGEDWRLYREGPVHSYLGYVMLGTLGLLALFFALRGKVRVEHGLSGVKIKRFSTLERFGHWLMALSFIILGISGLNVTFGRSLLLPLMGKDAFGPFSGFLKTTHNYTAFAFMLGLAIAFVLWVVHNIPDRYDAHWLKNAGGLLSKSNHPPSRKFNAGQKIIFWGVMVMGLSMSLSGWALLFPFDHHFFSDTFGLFARVGLDIPALLGLPPAPYSVIQEQQFNTAWHGIVGVVMICLIFAHIYIGTIGMEGAFDAMGSGEVDLNWAKEHHSVWVSEVVDDAKDAAQAAPAE